MPRFSRTLPAKQLFPGWLSSLERPFLPRASGSAAFDAEGVATRDRALVDGGVLTGYVLSSYSARRLGLETTGNAGGIHNLLVAGRLTPAAELLERGRHRPAGHRSDGPGCEHRDRRLLARGGRVLGGGWCSSVYPVEEVTIAGNLRNMFAAVRRWAMTLTRAAISRPAHCWWTA